MARCRIRKANITGTIPVVKKNLYERKRDGGPLSGSFNRNLSSQQGATESGSQTPEDGEIRKDPYTFLNPSHKCSQEYRVQMGFGPHECSRAHSYNERDALVV